MAHLIKLRSVATSKERSNVRRVCEANEDIFSQSHNFSFFHRSTLPCSALSVESSFYFCVTCANYSCALQLLEEHCGTSLRQLSVQNDVVRY